MTITNAELAAMSSCIAENIHPERIILFGSLARGEANEDSDIDLLVVVTEEFEGRSRWHELEKIRNLLASFPMAKDILLYSRDEVARWRHRRGDRPDFDIRAGGTLSRPYPSVAIIQSPHRPLEHHTTTLTNLATWEKIGRNPPFPL